MSDRVKMDWLLFWTILGLVSLGLVMVYSASAVMDQLKAPTPALADEITASASASGSDASSVPAAATSAPSHPESARRRMYIRRAVVIGLTSLFLFTLFRRYSNGQATWKWLLMGCAATAAMNALVFFQDPTQGAHYAFLLRQALAALFGFLLLMLLSQRDYRTLATPQCAFFWLGMVIFLLIVVYFVDSERHRWFNFGISIQPSEFAKPALIVFLAWFVTMRGGDVNNRYTMWPAALALCVLGGAVVVPDFGTALVLVATAAAVFYLAGLNWRYTATAMALGLVLFAAAVVWKPYRLKRVIDFVDPQYKYLVHVDPQKKLLKYAESGSKIKDTRYHAVQSTIAVGPGGLGGRGLMQSRQKLLFLPEAHTDYIYAVLAEELGFWGSALVVIGFMVILWRGYRLFLTATDEFGRYIAVGVTTTIVFQALLNMSVVLDLGPTKGIPLPLISFGGSSMVSTMILLGLLLSVSQRSTATQ
ncbi:MAG: FtsW/RodA/SpoVE family cell cycle protein [Bryobacterales bacterium]|nr:FtsW/RodA/SpoVE family cell cycle protein [Bryobacterales bacterium]